MLTAFMQKKMSTKTVFNTTIQIHREDQDKLMLVMVLDKTYDRGLHDNTASWVMRFQSS